MPGPVNLWIVSPYRFYQSIVEILERSGAEISLVCAQQDKMPDAGVARSALRLIELDVMAGHFPASIMGKGCVVEPALLSGSAVYEGTGLEIIDRLNGGGLPVQALRGIWKMYLGFWAAAVESLKPEAVLFSATPHMGHDFPLYVLCKLKAIRTIIVDHTYFDNHLFLRESIEDVPWQKTRCERVPVDANSVPSSLFDKKNRELNDWHETKRRLGRLFELRALLRPACYSSLIRRSRDWSYAFEGAILGVTDLWRRRGAARRVRRYLEEYESASGPVARDAPYVFYPLHYQPERSTLPGGGDFSDQLYVAMLVSEALPHGWILVVKEHPRQFRAGTLFAKARSPNFLKELLSTERVRLAPMEAGTAELIRNSRAVVTVTGTGAWQAAQMGVPGLVFGWPWYLGCPGVTQIRDKEQCREALESIARGKHSFSRSDVEAFGQTVLHRFGFRASFSDALLAESNGDVTENAVAYANAITAKLLGERNLDVGG